MLASVLTLAACASTATTIGSADNAARLTQVEARLAALQLNAVDAQSYAMAEASAWYEFAFDAYAQGERGVVVSEALGQSESILRRVECCGGVIHVQSPVQISRAPSVRPDLWSRLAALQQHERFVCAQGDVARMRVQLIAAGHAHDDLGWRHARPYVQAVERYARRAERRLEHCNDNVAEQLDPAPNTWRAIPTQSEQSEAILVPTPRQVPRQ